MGKHVIQEVSVIEVEKRRVPTKHYVYIILVSWSDNITTKIYRRYSVLFDFQCKLLDRFPDEAGVYDPLDRIIPFLPGKKYIGRSHIRKVALERLHPINEYCQALIKLPPLISQSEDVLEFFTAENDDINPPTQEKEKKVKADKISQPKISERYVSIGDYHAEKPGEVDLRNGMLIVDIVEKSESGWWFVTTDEAQGWAPSTYLAREDGGTDAPVFRAKPGNEEKYMVTENYLASCDDELTVGKYDIVDVLEKNLNGWWLVSLASEEGLVPASYLKPQPTVCNNRDSLALAPKNVEVISNLSEISQFFQKSDSTASSDKVKSTLHTSKQPPPRTASLQRGTSPASPTSVATYVTIAEFCDKVGDGISFHIGEPVKVLEKTTTGWWYVEIAGDEGWAPASYIRSQLSPNKTSPKQEISSFESDDSFSSEDSDTPCVPIVKNKLPTEYVTKPPSLDEARAGKVKADCGEGVAMRNKYIPPQVGRRSSGSAPSTPTTVEPPQIGALLRSTDQNNIDTKKYGGKSRHSIGLSGTGETPVMPLNEIKNLFGNQSADKPFKLKSVDKAKLSESTDTPTSSQKSPLSVPQKKFSLPDPPHVARTKKISLPPPPKPPGHNFSNDINKHSANISNKPVSSQNSASSEISNVQASLKTVIGNKNVTGPTGSRPNKPMVPQKKTSNADVIINSADVANNVCGDSVNNMPSKPLVPKKSAAKTDTQSQNRNNTDDSNNVTQDLAAVLKKRLNKNEKTETATDINLAENKHIQKPLPIKKPVNAQKPPPVHKPSTVQKPPTVQKPSTIQKPSTDQKPSTVLKPAVIPKPKVPMKNGGAVDTDRTQFNNSINKVNDQAVLHDKQTRDGRDAVPAAVGASGDVETFVAVADFVGENEGEITLREGVSVTIQQRDSTGWWFVSDGKTEGWAPMTYLEPEPSSNRNSTGLPKPSKAPKPIKR